MRQIIFINIYFSLRGDDKKWVWKPNQEEE